MTERPRLLYLITEDWYFWSHRLDLARAAAEAGFEVSIATRVADHGERIRQQGFHLCPITLVRRSTNPVAELMAILQLVKLYRRERPVIVHHVAMKPILYGSLAARLTGIPVVVNAFAGLGYTFTDRQRCSGFLGACVRYALKAILKLNHSIVVFQNRDDRDLLIEKRIVKPERTRIIPGSGVDTKTFDIHPPAAGDPIVMLASRMLRDKGIEEFVDAARRLRRNGLSARFVLVGRYDEQNPAAIEPHTIEAWVRQGAVEWWGHKDDIASTLASAAVVVLPSYREGLPKVLLEGAASGKPLVATDVPGCREIVTHGINGFLVPPRDAVALAAAIDTLLGDSSLRAAMGVAGREAVIRTFSVEKVAAQVIDLYRQLLIRRKRGQELPGIA